MSTEPVHLLNPLDSPEPELPPPEPTNPTVGSRSPPIELDPFGSAGGFPPQKPEPPDPTIKSTKSDEIERFSDKELLEIHQIRRYFLFSDEDLLEIHQIQRDLIKIYSRFDKSSQISSRSRPIRWNIGTGGEISVSTTKPETKPTPTRNPTDLNQMIRPLKQFGFGFDFNFDFYPPEKFGLGPGQAQTWPSPTRGHPYPTRPLLA